MTRYFLFAGEASGDLHGSQLMQTLKADGSSALFYGIGGPLMRAQGIEGPLKMEEFQVMGFSDVIKALPRLWRTFYQVRDLIVNIQPDIAILIDYPGFNLRLAKSLRKQGYRGKIVQYISPTVWAHGKKRIQTMAETLDLLLTIFPFEEEYFSHTDLKVKYIGNPLVDNFHRWRYDEQWTSSIGLSSNAELIAIFPGSREAEICRHTPLQLQAAIHLKQQLPQIKFGLSYAREELLPLMRSLIEKTSLVIGQDLFFVPSQFRYELMHDCRTALAKSGTVALELALHRKPSLILYSLTQLNYYIAKYILRLNLPHYCIVNILGKGEIYPEFIGRNLCSAAIAKKLYDIHTDEIQRASTRLACSEVIEQLGHQRSHQAAAQAIQELL